MDNEINKMINEQKLVELNSKIAKYNSCVSLTNNLKRLLYNPKKYNTCIESNGFGDDGEHYCSTYYYNCLEFEEFEKNINKTKNMRIKLNAESDMVHHIDTAIDTTNNIVTFNLS